MGRQYYCGHKAEGDVLPGTVCVECAGVEEEPLITVVELKYPCRPLKMTFSVGGLAKVLTAPAERHELSPGPHVEEKTGGGSKSFLLPFFESLDSSVRYLRVPYHAAKDILGDGDLHPTPDDLIKALKKISEAACTDIRDKRLLSET